MDCGVFTAPASGTASLVIYDAVATNIQYGSPDTKCNAVTIRNLDATNGILFNAKKGDGNGGYVPYYNNPQNAAGAPLAAGDSFTLRAGAGLWQVSIVSAVASTVLVNFSIADDHK